MAIVSSPEERWAAQLMFRAARGKPTFGVEGAKEIAREVEALPAHERANRLRLLDLMTEPERRQVQTTHGNVPVVIDAVSRPTPEAARFLNEFVRTQVDPAAPLVGEVFGDGRLSTAPESVLLRGDAIDFSDSPETRLRSDEVLTRRGPDGDAAIMFDRMGWVAVDPVTHEPAPPMVTTPTPSPAEAPPPAPAPAVMGIVLRTDPSAPPHQRWRITDSRGERPASDDVVAALRARPKRLDELVTQFPQLPIRALVTELLRAGVIGFTNGVISVR